MLQLKDIVKNYFAGGTTIEALKGINLDFRKSEFVAVLGPSGCGKTTLLNIVGGLDRYTSGDLTINGVSTKQYKDVDWDIYRNNSIGFVFQSYNLIPHQTALANVELAMTLAGISKNERRARAAEALEKVGLGDQLNKKPNQMSGGQMQRVSIARALVNNPDILLADEPTGALDSETSVQIMEILKEIAKDRLVIMVTHNPDLADKYANRIIRLFDGKITDDTNPYLVEETQKTKPKKKKVSMSFFTALSLSLNNLLTKKTRTVLTAFAGSIGIIGIALIMSLSSGMQGYIDTLQQDTLSTYPIQLQSLSMDMSSMMSTMMSANNRGAAERELDRVYSNNIVTDMASTMSSQITQNDLSRFRQYLMHGDGTRIVDELTNYVQYGYDIDINIYRADTADGILQLNPGSVMDRLGMTNSNEADIGGMTGRSGMGGGIMGGGDIWTELISNDNLLMSQYDLIAGAWPSAYNEVVLVIDSNNQLSDADLYSLGILDENNLNEILRNVMRGEEIEEQDVLEFAYEELLALSFKLVLATDYYEIQTDGEMRRWVDMRDDENFMLNAIENGIDINISGILRPSEEAAAASIDGTIGYTYALTEHVINAVLNSEIATAQTANPEINVFTGFAFDLESVIEAFTIEDLDRMFQSQDEMSEEEQAQFNAMTEGKTDEEILEMFKEMMREQLMNAGELDTYESNLAKLNIVDFDNPSSISLYPRNFADKEEIIAMIDEYNKANEDAGNPEYAIHYTDFVGMMTAGISSIINIISYVLIAFVSISLIVSSIMIAIITYISVLERTKEIGILRSIGASKRDITSVFNAETVIIGLVAGALGIGITALLNIPINMVIKSLTGISGIAALPVIGAAGLILLSVVLTVLAGFIPSKMAAKKDPVVALRTE